jgi:uncharacterized RDD family membrane protein YckC
VPLSPAPVTEDRPLPSSNLPSLDLGSQPWDGEAPDPLAHPEYYENIVVRRAVAYLVDVLVVTGLLIAIKAAMAIVGVMTFGLLAGPLAPLLALVPLAYHTLMIGGPDSATLGMRLFGLEVRTWTGGRPSYPQALIMTAVFYSTVWLTGFAVLLVALFNQRRRTLHDILCGTIVINSRPRGILLADEGSATLRR